MPNAVETYMPWRILLWAHNRIADVAHSGGFNTQPLVTMDYEEYKNASTDQAVFVESATINMVDNNLGGGFGATRVEVEVLIAVHGSVQYKAGNPQMALMALLQDVKTALSTNMEDMRATVGRGVTGRFAGVTLAYGTLDAKNEAIFRLDVSFKYQQNAVW